MRGVSSKVTTPRRRVCCGRVDWLGRYFSCLYSPPIGLDYSTTSNLILDTAQYLGKGHIVSLVSFIISYYYASPDMASNASWPPKSPHAALLSSPSGKRKFRECERNKENCSSPVKALAEAVNFDGEDDDEETLQLKLAAIEAKLKLKKLQHKKAQAETGGLLNCSHDGSRPTTSYSAAVLTANDASRQTLVSVPLSPSKRDIEKQPQRSPGRVLLGIDKGATAANISLRRAKTAHSSLAKPTSSRHGRQDDRPSAYQPQRRIPGAGGSANTPAKTFSERMAEIRDGDKQQQMKQEALEHRRETGHKFDALELQRYRQTADLSISKTGPLKAPSSREPETIFSRDDIVQSQSQQPPSRQLKKSRTLPDLRQPASAKSVLPTIQPVEADEEKNLRGDASLFEPLSGLNLTRRILPHSFLKRTLPTETFSCLRLPELLKHVKSPDYELPESITNFAVFAIVASKSDPLDHKGSKVNRAEEKSKGANDWERKWDDGSQNQKKFMALTITDLKWSVDLYLFGTALKRYYRLAAGTVVAIVDPSIMPPRKGREDTGAFSLSLHSEDDTVLEIGTSRDLGFCNAVKKDGKECGAWVNASKTEICEFHLNLQISRTQSKRMGVNTGTNGFGSAPREQKGQNGLASKLQGDHDGGLLPRNGNRYDRESGNRFYISSSTPGTGTKGAGAPRYDPDRNTARLLDLDDDDPFIAEGQLSRDKDALLRRRMATLAAQSKIANQLADLHPGGAVGEYLRHKNEKNNSALSNNAATTTSTQASATSLKEDIVKSLTSTNGNGKRFADDVRLSPMKKARFVKPTGARSDERDLLGLGRSSKAGPGEDEDLDIV